MTIATIENEVNYAALAVRVPQDLPKLPNSDRLYGLNLTLPVSIGDLIQKLPITVGGGQFHINPIFFRCSSTRAARVSTSSASFGSGVA